MEYEDVRSYSDENILKRIAWNMKMLGAIVMKAY